jgi:hypothetical protein
MRAEIELEKHVRDSNEIGNPMIARAQIGRGSDLLLLLAQSDDCNVALNVEATVGIKALVDLIKHSVALEPSAFSIPILHESVNLVDPGLNIAARKDCVESNEVLREAPGMVEDGDGDQKRNVVGRIKPRNNLVPPLASLHTHGPYVRCVMEMDPRTHRFFNVQASVNHGRVGCIAGVSQEQQGKARRRRRF